MIITAILDRITGWLDKLQLTATQWLLLSMAAIIGVLVAALRVQGSALHKAQVTLLMNNIAATDSADSAAVTLAQARFSKAYSEYIKAKQ